MTAYHYIESGLDNVFINGLEPIIDDEGDEVITINSIAALHVEIARGIVTRDGSMTGNELRFLRSEMGMTQMQLASVVNKEGQTVGRWERDEFPIDPNAETLIRRMAGEKLIEAFDQSIEELVQRIHSPVAAVEINIAANNNGGYSLCAA